MALAIFLIVGAEVAMNTNIANILVARYDITLEKAVIGISVFYAGETISRLIGGVVLSWFSTNRFLLFIVLIALLGILGVFLAPVSMVAFIAIFLTGLGMGSMFPVIFSLALNEMPDHANEISGLLIMAVSGGAVIPLLMGFVITLFGSASGILVLGICMLYILSVYFFIRKRN
jgi:fucose permease